MDQWSATIQQDLGLGCQVRMPSDGKVVIEANSSMIQLMLDWLSDREHVLWAEERPALMLLNKYTKCVVQNSTTDTSSNMLWSTGLTGAGKVVGCADTGWRPALLPCVCMCTHTHTHCMCVCVCVTLRLHTAICVCLHVFALFYARGIQAVQFGFRTRLFPGSSGYSILTCS